MAGRRAILFDELASASNHDVAAASEPSDAAAAEPRHSLQQLTSLLLKAFAGDFSAHGDDAIAKLRVKDPAAYLRLAVSLLPKELPDASLLDQVSDDELATVVREVRAMIDARQVIELPAATASLEPLRIAPGADRETQGAA
jgi:hypothetical protein